MPLKLILGNVTNLGVSVELGKKTNFGSFKLVAGGINFLRFSDFSLSSARQIRNSLFDRNAWTAVWPVNVQFNNYFDKSNYVVLTKKNEKLTKDFFVNLLEMRTTWKEIDLSLIHIS